jgi:glycosyltransferase involved in cell wall biosynthesis
MPIKNKIGIFMNNVSYYSGGRVMALAIAYKLAEMGHEVRIFTDNIPPIKSDFEKYGNPERVKYYIGTEGELVDFALIVPLHTKGFDYVRKYNVKCGVLFFETPNFVIKTRNGVDAGEDYWIDYKKNTIELADVAFCLPGISLFYCEEWLRDAGFNKPVMPLETLINTRSADGVEEQEKVNEIVYVGRGVAYKSIEDITACMAYSTTKPTINFVGWFNRTLERSLETTARLNNTKVVFHGSVNDDEKFKIIKRCKALILPSHFEGYGMTPAEAVYCKTVAIAYDLPILRSNYGDTVTFAKFGHRRDLARNIDKVINMSGEEFKIHTEKNKKELIEGDLVRCLPEKIEQDLTKYFTNMDFKQKPPLTITAGMIVFNGMDTIGLAIISIINNVDKLLIVEGVVEDYKRVNPHIGVVSDDGTHEFLKNLNHEKITVIQKGIVYKNKNELQNELYGLVDTDLYMKVDCDEIVEPKSINLAIKEFKLNPQLKHIMATFYHYWGDTSSVAFGGAWSTPIERIWRWNKKYRHGNHKQDFNFFEVDGNRVVFTDSETLISMDIIYHHLGYCRKRKNIEDKINYYENRRVETSKDCRVSKNWRKGEPPNYNDKNSKVVKRRSKLPDILKNYTH